MDRSFVAHLVGDPAADLEGENGRLCAGPWPEPIWQQCTGTWCQLIRILSRKFIEIPFQAAHVGVEDADAAADIRAQPRLGRDVIPRVQHRPHHLGAAVYADRHIVWIGGPGACEGTTKFVPRTLLWSVFLTRAKP